MVGTPVNGVLARQIKGFEGFSAATLPGNTKGAETEKPRRIVRDATRGTDAQSGKEQRDEKVHHAPQGCVIPQRSSKFGQNKSKR